MLLSSKEKRIQNFGGKKISRIESFLRLMFSSPTHFRRHLIILSLSLSLSFSFSLSLPLFLLSLSKCVLIAYSLSHTRSLSRMFTCCVLSLSLSLSHRVNLSSFPSFLTHSLFFVSLTRDRLNSPTVLSLSTSLNLVFMLALFLSHTLSRVNIFSGVVLSPSLFLPSLKTLPFYQSAKRRQRDAALTLKPKFSASPKIGPKQ